MSCRPFGITGIIFIVVFTLPVYAIIKFRGRAGDAGRFAAETYDAGRKGTVTVTLVPRPGLLSNSNVPFS